MAIPEIFPQAKGPGAALAGPAVPGLFAPWGTATRPLEGPGRPPALPVPQLPPKWDRRL